MPRVHYCNVKHCGNSSLKAERSGREDLSFHKFPKDPSRKRKWIELVAMEEKATPEKSFICSDHFLASDYERCLQLELQGIKPRIKLLRADAFPSLKLPAKYDTTVPGNSMKPVEETVLPNSHKLWLGKSHKLILPKMAEGCMMQIPVQEYQSSIVNVVIQPSVDNVPHVDQLLLKKCCEIEALKKELEELKTTIASKDVELKILQQRMREEMEQRLRERFSENQLHVLLNKKKITKWSSDEITKGLTLRYCSKKAYAFVRDELKYPLPGISTLQRWASKIDVSEGILVDVLNFMKVTGYSKDIAHKLTVLSFGEMKVTPLSEYNEDKYEMVGPHNKMQMVMARGLCAKWKQPVYIGFDKKVTKDLLHDIMSKLHAAGFIAVACVSDCEEDNISLWRELGLSHSNPCFEHPVTGKGIFYFPNASHLVKLIRNWLLDTGFTLEDGTEINKKPLEAFSQLSKRNKTVFPKISDLHLNCCSNQRENVKLATKLISHAVANSLKRYKSVPEGKLVADVASFIELVSDWYTIMNVHVGAQHNPKESTLQYKDPYGSHLDVQRQKLDEFHSVVSTMRCTGETALMPFQEGILISIKSTQMLLESLKEHGVKQILTANLSQISLKSLFSRLRDGEGYNDHPSPMNACSRLRTIISCKSHKILQAFGSKKDVISEDFVGAPTSRRIFQKEGKTSSDTDSASETEAGELPAMSDETHDAIVHLEGWIEEMPQETQTRSDLGCEMLERASTDHAYSMVYL